MYQPNLRAHTNRSAQQFQRFFWIAAAKFYIAEVGQRMSMAGIKRQFTFEGGFGVVVLTEFPGVPYCQDRSLWRPPGVWKLRRNAQRHSSSCPKECAPAGSSYRRPAPSAKDRSLVQSAPA